MAAGIGLGISMGWALAKKGFSAVIEGLFAILEARSTFFENANNSKLGVQELETAGLLDKASIILTPTGYSVDNIHNLKPSSTLFGDMTLIKNGTCTRVNENGFVETVASDVPRIDYSKGDGAILCENSSVNEIRYSEDFSNALWTKGAIGLTSSTGTNPRGESATIYAIQGAPVDGGLEANMASTATGNGVGVSCWVRKKDGQGTVNVEIGYGDSFYGASHTVSVGADWQRITYTSTGYTGANRFYIRPQNILISDTIEVWGAQMEKTANGVDGLVTSYIPTQSSASTRLADSYLDGGDVSLINSTSGVLFVERQCLNTNTNEWILLTATGRNEAISVGIYGTSNGSNSTRVKTSTSTLYKGFQGSKTSMEKLAVKWDGTEVKTFRNGALIQTGTLSGGFTANQLTELHLSTGQGFNGRLKQLIVYKEALSDAELAALTS